MRLSYEVKVLGTGISYDVPSEKAGKIFAQEFVKGWTKSTCEVRRKHQNLLLLVVTKHGTDRWNKDRTLS